MKTDDFALKADDGVQIACVRWSPDDGAPKAIVQILHGMSEHCLRYARLAERLTAAGYVVYAHDHRGHGRTAKDERNVGHYADTDGWQRVIADLRMVGEHARSEHPELRMIVLAHSMGSFMAQHVLEHFPADYDAYALSGSNALGGPLVTAGKQAAKLERLRQGPRGKSALLEFLSFGSFNDAFKPARTAHDWLSRDPIEVDKYIADPRCGFRCTNQLWVDLLGALEALGHADWKRVPKGTPVYLFAGDRDPVGNKGKGVEELGRRLSRAGISRLEVKLYPEARHETLNEINRDDVMSDLIGWMGRALS